MGAHRQSRSLIPPALKRAVAWTVPGILLGGAAMTALPSSAATAGPGTDLVPREPAAPAVPAAHPLRSAPVAPQVVRVTHRRTRYTVRSGDTLSGIAKRFCGKALDWTGIYKRSKDVVGPDPNMIVAGQRLAVHCAVVDALVAAALPPAPPPPPATHNSPPAQQAAPPAAAPAVAVTGTLGANSLAGMSGFEQCVINAESGGNPTAVNPSSGAGGLFQFLPSTWASLGEAGAYPGGAQTAPVGVQEAAFAKLYAEAGTSPWAPYDGC